MPEDTQKRYPCTCVACSHTFYACKSIGQSMGMHDAGCGSCPSCNEFLNLTFNPANETMQTRKWDEYIQETTSQRSRLQ